MNWKARPWRAALSTVTMALALAGPTPEVHALAVGRITVLSALGQPLRAEIDILNIDSDESATLKAGIASAEAFRGAGMEYNPLLQNVTVSIVRRGDGRTVLQLASERPVNEPFVDLILETSWATGRILRGYTMLFDPPRIQAQEVGSSPTARSVPASTTPAAAPSAPIVVPPADSQGARKSELGTGGQITVKPGDSASRIASAHKPANVSLDQMLVALLQANPDAFARGNLNRLKAGAVLNLPLAEQAGSIAPAEASRIVVAQSQDFGDYRKKLAENVPTAQSAPSQRQASGNVKTQVDEKKGPVPAPDKLTLSKGSTQAKASVDAASKDKQAKEAAARVAELAKNIDELNKVKGALTAASAAAGTATGAAPATATAQAGTAAPAVVPPPPAAPVSPASTPSVKAPSPAKPAPTPTPTPERSLMDQILGNQLALLAGAGLVALLGALGFMRARRRKSEQVGPQASVLDSRLQPESFFKASGHNVDTNAVAAGSSMMYSPSQLDSAGDVDPVAEADVYLAYGRDIQAEEILREAMRLNPTRLAIHAKLLGIFAKRRDLKSFETVARDAHALSAGAGPEWEAIARMGQELDPTNALFQGDAPAQVRPVATAASDDAPTPTPTPPPPTVVETPAAPVMVDRPVASPKADVDLDFDLDISPAAAPSAPSGSAQADAPDPVPTAMAPAPAQAVADEGLISFDLDSPPAPAAVAAPAPGPEAGMIEFDMGGLSLDLDAPAPATDGSANSSDDPLATKLALAEEFEAIGDTEGAKLILEEVIAEASGDLKVRAQRALSKLG